MNYMYFQSTFAYINVRCLRNEIFQRKFYQSYKDLRNRLSKLNVNSVLTYTARSHSRPIFVDTPGNITLTLGETAEFKVKIFSDPEYLVNWVKHSSTDPDNRTIVQVTYKL